MCLQYWILWKRLCCHQLLNGFAREIPVWIATEYNNYCCYCYERVLNIFFLEARIFFRRYEFLICQVFIENCFYFLLHIIHFFTKKKINIFYMFIHESSIKYSKLFSESPISENIKVWDWWFSREWCEKTKVFTSPNGEFGLWR